MSQFFAFWSPTGGGIRCFIPFELWQFTNDSLYALYIYKVYVSGRNHRFVHSNFVISGVMVSTVFWSSL
jgi:hypothetical protein